jgi:hypothetical protein
VFKQVHWSDACYRKIRKSKISINTKKSASGTLAQNEQSTVFFIKIWQVLRQDNSAKKWNYDDLNCQNHVAWYQNTFRNRYQIQEKNQKGYRS